MKATMFCFVLLSFIIIPAHNLPARQITIINPSADAYVDESIPNTNYGSAQLLFAGPQGSKGNNMDLQFFMKFDLSAFTGKTISRALLVLFRQRDASAVLKMSLLTSSWNENNVTWNTSPFDASVFKTFTVDGGGVSLDITQQVKDWISGITPNHGVQIRSDFNQASSNNYHGFYSREWANGEQRPKLGITLASTPGSFVVYDTKWDNQVDNDYDSFTSSRQLSFDIDVSDGSTRTVYAKIWYKAASSSTYLLYHTTPNFQIIGDDADAYFVYIGSPNTELMHDNYDIEIHVYEAGNSSPVAFRRPSYDANLYQQKFERANEDQALQKNSLSFDGNNDYVRVPNSPSLNITGNKITLEAWIKPSSIPPIFKLASIIGKGGNDIGRGYEMLVDYTNNGRIQFIIAPGPSTGTLNSNTFLQANTKYHVACVYDGSTMKIYINGILDASSAMAGNIASSSDDVLIGKRSPSNNFAGYFVGVISEARIWNTARTQTQIQNTMNHSPYSRNDANGLIAIWHLNEGTGQVVQDKANGNNGTLGASVNIEAEDPSWVNSDIVVPVKEESIVPDEFILKQNYPNPFNPRTTIEFSIAQESRVSLRVYNILGEVVAKLIEGESMNAGVYRVKWDAQGVPSGVYLYEMNVNGDDGKGFVERRKMLLVR